MYSLRLLYAFFLLMQSNDRRKYD